MGVTEFVDIICNTGGITSHGLALAALGGILAGVIVVLLAELVD